MHTYIDAYIHTTYKGTMKRSSLLQCVCVCMCIHISSCVCTHTYMHTYIHTHTHSQVQRELQFGSGDVTWMCMCMFICSDVCVCARVRHTHTQRSAEGSAFWQWRCKNVIQTNIYTKAYLHVYTYKQTNSQGQSAAPQLGACDRTALTKAIAEGLLVRHRLRVREVIFMVRQSKTQSQGNNRYGKTK